MPARIPICLITGFLGCGKTTLLKQIVARYRTQELVYLVNEFSPHDIDGAIVSAEHPDVISVPGGSIFCKCLVTQFIEQMQLIPERFPSVQGVIIEASGMANPKVIHRMLDETGLDKQYRIARIVTVVDPGSFHKLRHTLPGIVSQIETADMAIINKTDIFDESTCEKTKQALLEINPAMEVVSACHCNVNFSCFPTESAATQLGGEYAKCKDPAFDTHTVMLSKDISPDQLKGWLDSASEDLFRFKGTVKWQNRKYHVDWTTSGFSTVAESIRKETAVVLIHRGSAGPAIQVLLDHLA